MKKSKLELISLGKPLESKSTQNGVIKLLLKDHKIMKGLMKKIKSQKSSEQKSVDVFNVLKKIVLSHVEAEEKSLLNIIKENSKFEDMALEGKEEHKIHEDVIHKIDKTKNLKIKVVRIKIFCEFLKHHLEEEETDLFPKFKKYSADSTRKKLGQIFVNKRTKTQSLNETKRVLTALN